jgi:hypothetical protein
MESNTKTDTHNSEKELFESHFSLSINLIIGKIECMKLPLTLKKLELEIISGF